MAVAVEPALLLAPGAMATPRWETGVTGVHMEASGVSLSFAGADTDEFGPSSRHLSEREKNGKIPVNALKHSRDTVWNGCCSTPTNRQDCKHGMPGLKLQYQFKLCVESTINFKQQLHRIPTVYIL